MSPPQQFRSIKAGVERLPGFTYRPRHRHLEGYATIVLAGAFTETSFAGRMIAEPGDVLLHGHFDCHMDVSRRRRDLQILRLPWSDSRFEGHFRIADPDDLVRLCARDPLEAVIALTEKLETVVRPPYCWTDTLAGTLRAKPSLRLQDWAECNGIRPDVVSQAFRRDFGVSPKLFRLEARTRSAWREIVTSSRALTIIAHDAGFSDLAHLSRSVRAFTGFSPSCWRTDLSRCNAMPTQFKQLASTAREGVSAQA